MPLTKKGEKTLASMREQYGKEEGERVFYASKNAGKITGVDDAHKLPHPGKGPITRLRDDAGEQVKRVSAMCDSLSARMDAFEKRRAMQKTQKVEPRNKDAMQPSNRHPKEIAIPKPPGSA